MAVNIQAYVFWIVMLCSIVVGYQCFRSLCSLHLQGEILLSSCTPAQHYNTELNLNLHCCENIKFLDRTHFPNAFL